MAHCKHLKGDGSSWYCCTLRKKRCAYQRYCAQKHAYLLDKCDKCPAFQEVDDK